MTAPEDLVVSDPADDTAALALVLAEIAAMQRSSSIDNEDFAAALRTCQDVLDNTLTQVQIQVPAQAQPAADADVVAAATVAVAEPQAQEA